MTDLTTAEVADIRRGAEFIARKYGADPDDTAQEALIAAWQRDGPTGYRIKGGYWRAREYAHSQATGGRRSFGHPGGKSYPFSPKGYVGEPIETDVIASPVEYTPGPLQAAVSGLPPRQQLAAWHVAIGTPPGMAASDMGITGATFRQLRKWALERLREELNSAY